MKVFKTASEQLGQSIQKRTKENLLENSKEADHIPSNILKAVVFRNFYLVHFWILCPNCERLSWMLKINVLEIKKWPHKLLKHWAESVSSLQFHHCSLTRTNSLMLIKNSIIFKTKFCYHIIAKAYALVNGFDISCISYQRVTSD